MQKHFPVRVLLVFSVKPAHIIKGIVQFFTAPSFVSIEISYASFFLKSGNIKGGADRRVRFMGKYHFIFHRQAIKHLQMLLGASIPIGEQNEAVGQIHALSAAVPTCRHIRNIPIVHTMQSNISQRSDWISFRSILTKTRLQ